MNNTVVLYKVQWTASSLNQPYFMSDTARDSYLENLVQKIVLENVNISLKPNLFLELIIPLDITESESYNYAKIVYNNKTYFANITDYEQISVNRTKLYLERHSLSERTNFLDLFHQFKINKCTLLDYKYGYDANISVPDFRVQRKVLLPSINGLETDGDFVQYMIYTTASGIVKKLVSKPMNFFCLYLEPSILKDSLYDHVDSIFGEKTQYALCFFTADERQTLHCKLHTNAPIVSDKDGTIIFEAITRAKLDYLSPYIKSMFFTTIPVGVDTNGDIYFPYKVYRYGYTKGEGIQYTTVFCQESNDYYSVELPISKRQLFTTIEARIYSLANSLLIKPYEFVSESGILYIDFSYIFNICGTEIIGNVHGDGTSVYQNNAKRFQFELGDSTTYLLDSESNFDAQNKYYDALTRNASKQILANGLIQSGVQISSGAIQSGVGFVEGNPFAVSEGSANVMRGIGSIATTVLNNKFYKKERSLMAKNERAKPDQVQTGGSSAINVYSQKGMCNFVVEDVFEEDYNDFISNLHYYGVETYLFRESILLDELSYDNHFFLQATAIIRDNGYIERQIYDDLYSLLSNGCRYFIVAEQ